MTAGWGARTVRAAVFAVVCALLAALGHVMMSGRELPAAVMAAGLGATGAVGWGLAGRERGLPLVVGVVLAVQAALHWGFTLAQSASASASSSAAAAVGSGGGGMTHAHHMDHGAADMAHMAHMHSMDGGGGSSSVGMFAAHLLAALLTGLWLAYGEKAAFRILRAVAGWLAAPLRLLLAPAVVPDRARPRPRRARSDRAPWRLLLAHAITSRGPPVGAAAV